MIHVNRGKWAFSNNEATTSAEPRTEPHRAAHNVAHKFASNGDMSDDNG